MARLTEHDCETARCTPAQLAEDDLAKWLLDVRATAARRGRRERHGGSHRPRPSRNRTTTSSRVTWREANSDIDYTYTVSMNIANPRERHESHSHIACRCPSSGPQHDRAAGGARHRIVPDHRRGHDAVAVAPEFRRERAAGAPAGKRALRARRDGARAAAGGRIRLFAGSEFRHVGQRRRPHAG